MNLYRVKLRGMQTSRTGMAYGDSYVLANDPSEAYQKVRKFLDKAEIGFPREREMTLIELLASEDQDNDTGKMIFI